jgi:hypothetical protein
MHWAVTFLGNGRAERTSTLRESGRDAVV